MPQAQRAAPAGTWAQPPPPRQAFQHRASPQRASPQPEAMHSAPAPFWQESAASQQVFYDPQQMYTAVPGEQLDTSLIYHSCCLVVYFSSSHFQPSLEMYTADGPKPFYHYSQQHILSILSAAMGCNAAVALQLYVSTAYLCACRSPVSDRVPSRPGVAAVEPSQAIRCAQWRHASAAGGVRPDNLPSPASVPWKHGSAPVWLHAAAGHVPAESGCLCR